MGKRRPQFYAVRCGRLPGIYDNWGMVEPLITGFAGAQFKGFSTKQEALEYLQRRDEKQPLLQRSSLVPKAAAAGAAGPAVVAATLSSMHPLSMPPGTRQVPVRIGVDGTPTDGSLLVYCDGACTRNGKSGAIAGIGVWFGDNDPRNISEPLKGPRQTNQRAELTAIIRTLEICTDVGRILICSDSRYAINCATIWSHTWKRQDWFIERNPWHKDAKENADLIFELHRLLDGRKGVCAFEYVPGHSGVHGNERADELATRAAAAVRAAPR